MSIYNDNITIITVSCSLFLIFIYQTKYIQLQIGATMIIIDIFNELKCRNHVKTKTEAAYPHESGATRLSNGADEASDL